MTKHKPAKTTIHEDYGYSITRNLSFKPVFLDHVSAPVLPDAYIRSTFMAADRNPQPRLHPLMNHQLLPESEIKQALIRTTIRRYEDLLYSNLKQQPNAE